MPGAGEKPSTSEDTTSTIVVLEEKARRLLKRGRYEESAKTFKEVLICSNCNDRLDRFQSRNNAPR